MRVAATITFEYLLVAPEVVRLDLDVANIRLAARRAVEGAQAVLPNRHFQSLLIRLEKGDDDRS